MNVRISRRTLRRLRWTGLVLVVFAALVGLYLLGDRLTPRGSDGRPLILSPSVRRAETYRRAVLGWAREMERVEEELDGLLSHGDVTDPTQLYDLSSDVEHLVERAASVVQDCTYTQAPPALVGLQAKVQAVADAHFEAAQAAALWVGAPGDAALQEARAILKQAQTLREQLVSSRWLSDESDDDNDDGEGK